MLLLTSTAAVAGELTCYQVYPGERNSMLVLELVVVVALYAMSTFL